MNALLYPEKLLRLKDAEQQAIPLMTPGVQRYVWESRFGEILIEVVGDQTFVNGQAVDPVEAGLGPTPSPSAVVIPAGTGGLA